MKTQELYFDFNANTPLAPEVAAKITDLMSQGLGNPSSSYQAGVRAKTHLEKARVQVANLIHARPDEIIFTSGGTESNNTVLHGVSLALQDMGQHIITSSIEHPAILEPLHFLSDHGVLSTLIPVDQFGICEVDQLEAAVRDDTILMTVMHANNEVGSIQPIRQISEVAKRHQIRLHTDAAQSIGKVPVNVDELGVDYLTIAGHKLYAPEGIGALYVRDGAPYAPMMRGGGQECGRRAGTENVLLAAALGHACELVQNEMERKMAYIAELRDTLEDRLEHGLGARLVINGHRKQRLPNTSHISILGADGRNILSRIPAICASTGSACHSGVVQMSPVLAAMGCSEEQGRGAIRLSLGRTTTREHVDEAVHGILNAASI
jgi:cysteine desulfurase